MSYAQIEEEYNRTKLRFAELEKQKREIEKTPEFKDAKIKELERRIVLLEEELKPHRKAAERKRIDDYGNLKCTGAYDCHCRSCCDL